MKYRVRVSLQSKYRIMGETFGWSESSAVWLHAGERRTFYIHDQAKLAVEEVHEVMVDG